MEEFGRLHRVEVISNRDFLEMSHITSAFPLNCFPRAHVKFL